MKTYPTLQKMCKEIIINDDIGGKDLSAIEADLAKLFKVLPILSGEKYRVDRLKFVRLPSRYAYYQANNTSIVLTTKNKEEGLTAFIHELGHLIDYQHGEAMLKPYSKVSKDNSWKEVVEVFRKHHQKYSKKEIDLVLNHRKQEWVEKEVWSSYDKYLRSAVEIFARGFEVYIAHKVGIRYICKSKSKLKRNLLWYPSGKKGTETIVSFYDQFFSIYDKK